MLSDFFKERSNVKLITIIGILLDELDKCKPLVTGELKTIWAKYLATPLGCKVNYHL